MQYIKAAQVLLHDDVAIPHSKHGAIDFGQMGFIL